MVKKQKKRTFRKIIIAIFIGFAVISFWRGIWGLMDLYLYPKNQAVSFTISILIGIIILYLTKHLIKELE